MSDNFRIDSHKLIFHPQRVAQWLAGEPVYPLYAELSRRAPATIAARSALSITWNTNPGS